jgi:ribosomal protein L4
VRVAALPSRSTEAVIIEVSHAMAREWGMDSTGKARYLGSANTLSKLAPSVVRAAIGCDLDVDYLGKVLGAPGRRATGVNADASRYLSERVDTKKKALGLRSVLETDPGWPITVRVAALPSGSTEAVIIEVSLALASEWGMGTTGKARYLGSANVLSKLAPGVVRAAIGCDLDVDYLGKVLGRPGRRATGVNADASRYLSERVDTKAKALGLRSVLLT